MERLYTATTIYSGSRVALGSRLHRIQVRDYILHHLLDRDLAIEESLAICYEASVKCTCPAPNNIIVQADL